MKIDITTREATMIYELLHEIKMKCVTEGVEEDRDTAKRIMEDCNGLMKKVEDVILAPGVGEGKTSTPKKKKGKKKSDS
tara:strand:+ start:458 stop:694 length:237 start_codon:yes stop_codon:yes gene_type:complete